MSKINEAEELLAEREKELSNLKQSVDKLSVGSTTVGNCKLMTKL